MIGAMQDGTATHRIDGLAALIREAQARGVAPVERWDPPYCGDIGLAIAADGTWSYRGSPIQRPALTKLFARVLRREADGRFMLVTPAEKVDVAVADAPFAAVEMEVRGSGRAQALTFRTNVDDVVSVDASHPLRFAAGAAFIPYVLVRGGLEARLSRQLAADLAHLSADADTPGVWSGGVWWPFPA